MNTFLIASLCLAAMAVLAYGDSSPAPASPAPGQGTSASLEIALDPVYAATGFLRRKFIQRQEIKLQPDLAPATLIKVFAASVSINILLTSWNFEKHYYHCFCFPNLVVKTG